MKGGLSEGLSDVAGSACTRVSGGIPSISSSDIMGGGDVVFLDNSIPTFSAGAGNLDAEMLSNLPPTQSVRHHFQTGGGYAGPCY